VLDVKFATGEAEETYQVTLIDHYVDVDKKLSPWTLMPWE
jgi:hypothetical protein